MMKVSGSAQVGADVIEHDPTMHLAALDEFKSYWPIPRRWTWGTGEGKSDKGRRVAFNMVDYYCRDQSWWNENCLWVDGRINFLGAARWTLDERKPDKALAT